MDTLIFNTLNHLETCQDISILKPFNEYLYSLQILYNKWFTSSKKYTDDHITNQILQLNIAPRGDKARIKLEMNCLIRSAERICGNIEKFEASNITLVTPEIKLLQEYITDSKVFFKHAFSVIDKKDIKIEMTKGYTLEPDEIIAASMMLLRNNIIEHHPGNLVVRYSSVFLIRQAIEVYMKNVFGIGIIQKNGVIQKIQPEIFFDFIDDNGVENKFPLKRATLQKIHKWTQTFVHGGFIPYIWEIEWNHVMLEPILCNFLSNVMITKSCIDKVQKKLRDKYGEDIHIISENPWKYAMIIDS